MIKLETKSFLGISIVDVSYNTFVDSVTTSIQHNGPINVMSLNLTTLKRFNEEFIYLNERLFIVYYDVSQRKQIQINKFTEKKDLLNSLLKSSHIPFITQNSLYYVDNETNSLDGGMPYVFPKRNVGDKKILYINICVYNKLTSLFSVKKELNPYGRLLEGALDAHNFFLHKANDLYYIN